MPAASVRTGLRSPGFAAVAAGLLAGQAAAAPKTPLVVERAILVMRHGIRAPLAGEVPVGTRTAVPWPAWPVTESRITPHGGRALEIVAAADRRLLATRGLLPTKGCSSRAIRIRTNSSQRTITSGEAYARGFAPGCPVEIEHLQLGTADPIFERCVPVRRASTQPRRLLPSSVRRAECRRASPLGAQAPRSRSGLHTAGVGVRCSGSAGSHHQRRRP